MLEIEVLTSLWRKRIENPVKPLYIFERISNNVVTYLNVVVHDLQKHITTTGDDLDNFTKRAAKLKVLEIRLGFTVHIA